MNNPFENKIAEVKYNTGLHFKIYYLHDNKLKYIYLKKDEYYGAEETVDTLFKQITDDIFSLTWVESTGFHVTQVIDLSRNWIYAAMSWPDENAYGKRAMSDQYGEIKFIKDEDLSE